MNAGAKIYGGRDQSRLPKPTVAQTPYASPVRCRPPMTSGEGGMIHNGEEFALVLEGRLQFVVNGDAYVLEKGDSLVFKASLPHTWKNVHDGQTIVMWVVSPAPNLAQ